MQHILRISLFRYAFRNQGLFPALSPAAPSILCALINSPPHSSTTNPNAIPRANRPPSLIPISEHRVLPVRDLDMAPQQSNLCIVKDIQSTEPQVFEKLVDAIGETRDVMLR